MTRTAPCDGAERRVEVVVTGAVQGVGFRPHVYRLAAELGLSGWVSNTPAGVIVEVEGGEADVGSFLERIDREAPPCARVETVTSRDLEPCHEDRFRIQPSLDGDGPRSALVLPDLATCEDCLRELFEPGDRRFRYPFINCTHCGPRFSIVHRLPYDRESTTMRRFALCRRCRAEYEDPSDRRFHAQPNACDECGPSLRLLSGDGSLLAVRSEVLARACGVLRAGGIVAVKGLGGYLLMVDARSSSAVRRLRQRKHRQAKPFALLFPDLASVEAHCEVSGREAELLTSRAAPIVLLERRPEATDVVPEVAPGAPCLGAMLPYTPLHHLMLADLGFPVVATSGNRSEEPICTDDEDALDRLGEIADVLLAHDRPIARPVDDSVVRVIAGTATLLRRARGYAPLPLPVAEADSPTLALGGHLSNTVAVASGGRVFASQHVGDLDGPDARALLARTSRELPELFGIRPETLVCDLHPDYASSRLAADTREPVVRVQHHYAHVLSCMADHGLRPPVLGIAWDGSGYGTDGTVWGGEFLLVTAAAWRRVAHLRTFPLPGGELAVREPRRAALGVLHEAYGARLWGRDVATVRAFTEAERPVLQRALERELNTPRTSSAGRLFDAVASLVGLRQRTSYSGQAAVELEASAAASGSPYDMPLVESPPGTPDVVDWAPLIDAVLADLAEGVSAGTIAARFHAALAESMATVARRVACPTVVLTGGCFQNRVLAESAVRRLSADGLDVRTHREVPPNDGGLSVGQTLAALRGRREEGGTCVWRSPDGY